LIWLSSCIRTVINLLIWRAEYGKSVGGRGGAEKKCKEGQTARHYEMLHNLKPVINN
jgi:hypothetical protein